ncbi:hypothetical protein ACFX2F_030937 [Malus domestica]
MSLRRDEHEAFLFYWYNKFICCTKSNKCLVKNMPVAEALTSGHSFALNPAILANLLRCLAETTTRSTRTRMDLSVCSNSGCRFIFPYFGHKSPTFSPLQHSAFSWLIDQYLFTELKKFSNTSSA